MATSLSAAKASHVAVIAFPFASHPFSTYRLALRLARSSPTTHFTFFSFPEINASLFKSTPPLANLKPYVLDDGIPAGQTESDLSFQHKIVSFYQSVQRPGNLKRQLAAATEARGAKFTCLMVDAVLGVYLADVADELSVPWIAMWSPSLLLLSAYVHTETIRRHCADAASVGGDAAALELLLDFVPGLEGVRVSNNVFVELFHGEFDERFRFLHAMSRLGQFLPRASAVVMNSFREFNRDGFNRDMEERCQSVLNVGFFTVSFPVMESSAKDDDPAGCLAWLDGRNPNSVVYISFGTFAVFSEDELRIMTEALEETGTSFLWSLPSEQQKLLPSGFVERTLHNGRLVMWTDQPWVLRHGSVGAHLMHCGVNSVNESVAYGVPIIYAKGCAPDNPLHAQMVERDWGIGVRVSDSGVLTKDELVRALEMVLKQDEGKKMKERVLSMKKLAIDASSPGGTGARDFDALVELLSAV